MQESGLPLLLAPTGSCDSHMHVFESGSTVADATAHDYRIIQSRLGISRTVVVQPRLYGTDNHVTLAAIASLGRHCTRGIAVAKPDVQTSELLRLHEGGIRGLRFTLYTNAHAVTTFEMVESLAHRIAALGWHVQLHWTADQIVTHQALLARLPCPMVFDHMARLSTLAHPAYGIVQKLIDQDRAWVKLSGPYLDSLQDASSHYADRHAIAQAWVRTAPQRLVWGSDWPHTTEQAPKPDDVMLFDLLRNWIPDAKARHRVLVDNPEELYDFPSLP